MTQHEPRRLSIVNLAACARRFGQTQPARAGGDRLGRQSATPGAGGASATDPNHDD
jgi:hypothetical protein